MYYRELFDYNSKLADEILHRLEIQELRRVIEFGSGSGLFTIPLMDRLYRMVDEYKIVDPFPGPYTKDKEVLMRRIREAGYQDKVSLVKAPIWNIGDEDPNAHLVIGHDVFCDLSMEQVEKAIRAIKNVLEDGGSMVHSGLSPSAKTPPERLLMKLDSLSSSPLIEGNWFSPGSEFLYVVSKKIGFGKIDIHEIKIPLTIQGKDARTFLKDWNVDEKVIEKYRKQIDEVGIEFPKEQVLICKK